MVYALRKKYLIIARAVWTDPKWFWVELQIDMSLYLIGTLRFCDYEIIIPKTVLSFRENDLIFYRVYKLN